MKPKEKIISIHKSLNRLVELDRYINSISDLA